MDDDLMPNDGTYFFPREPADQIIGRKKEKAKTLEALTVLQELLDRLDKRIEFYASVDAMPDDVKTDAIKFMNMHNANQMVRDNLRSEKEWIEGLLDIHAPNR